MSTVARFSIEQFDRMIAGGVFEGPNRQRIELIHGELRQMSAIGPAHEHLADELNAWSLQSAPDGQVRVRNQHSIGLPSLSSVPEPDLAWVVARFYRQARPIARDVLLLIEVSESSLDYDRGEKADLYAAAEVADYWVVNMRDRCVEVFRDPHRGHYRNVTTFELGDEIHPLAFPKIALCVARLFA